MYTNIWDRQQRLHILKELKRVVIDIRYLKQYEIMNRNEQELYSNIKRLAIAMEKLVKLMTKAIKDNG